MGGTELVNELGKVGISEEVVATIAGIAATECYGIVGMASRNIRDGIVELLGRENLSRGVEVSIDGGKAVVNLYVIVGYGLKISEIARNVIEKVRYAVESMVGLEVSEVNVNVEGVKITQAR